ncbi:hypothetical protein [Devosia sp. CN2-171]|uniref:hypothetical protein n=1 Tax=Devosia sp. CN2-171 TaxID=3400909 RepID=UPI003BF92743
MVSVTIGEKLTAGQPTGELSLVAHVTRKGDVEAGDMVPATIEIAMDSGNSHLRTDVCELLGLPRALAARAGDTIWSADGDFGTTCLTFVKNGNGYVATNAHVVANIAQGRFFLPNVMRPAGSVSPLTLGDIAYMSPFGPGRTAREDLAIIQTTQGNVQHLGMVGQAAPIARIDSFTSHLGAPYWYNVNGMRVTLRSPQPSPVGLPTPMLIDGIWYPYGGFWMLNVTAGQVEHGHSGAVICRGEGNDISACGILFGGVLPNIAYAFPLQPTFRRAYDQI